MRVLSSVLMGLFLLLAVPAQAGLFDDLLGGIEDVVGGGGASELPIEKIASGLKEALSVGTGKAVDILSQAGGYFSNEAVKILIPEKIRAMTDTLRKVGFGGPVDEFELSMNRAAETAANKAAPIFLDAIKEMSFEDAKKILDGSDTAATEYLRGKTSGKISEAFKPVIKNAMNEVGVTQSYQELTDRFNAIPFMQADSIQLEPYVTDKAMDGIFKMVAEQEKLIRTNPEARVTDLLKEVFQK